MLTDEARKNAWEEEEKEKRLDNICRRKKKELKAMEKTKDTVQKEFGSTCGEEMQERGGEGRGERNRRTDGERPEGDQKENGGCIGKRRERQ